MTEKELQELQRGDTVKHKETGLMYVIIKRDDETGHAVGIGECFIISPDAWDLFSKSEKRTK